MKLPTFQNPLKLFTPAFAGPAQGAVGPNGGHMMFSSSGSGGGGRYDDDDYSFDDDFGYEDEAPQEEPPPGRRPQSNRTRRSSSGRANANGGRSRSASVQPEERYWTDYLRIALPVIGIILFLGLLWIWASQLLGGDDNNVEDPPEDTIGLVEEQTADPNEVNTEPTGVSTPGQETEGGEIPIPGDTTPAATNPPFNPTDTEEEPAAGGDNQTGEETTTDEEAPPDEETPAGEIAIDSQVVIPEEGVNIRSSPSAADESNVLRQSTAGETATVISGPEEAEDFVWWELVFEDGSSGYVVEDFLEPAAP